MNILSAIEKAKKIFKKKKLVGLSLDIEILLSYTLKISRKDIILNPQIKIKKEQLDMFFNLIARKCNGEPTAYLTNKKDFWCYEFFVNKNTLIPRPDSELIVEYIINKTDKNSNLTILDVGIGSGCLLLSILKERKKFIGTGIDVSKNCLKISKINAKNLNVHNRIKLFHSDIDNFQNHKYDMIISNPPYINKFFLKYLDKEIVDYEPKVALDGGLDGFSVIRKVIKNSSRLIKKNGKLILEIAFNQKEKTCRMLINEGFYINNILKDFGNKDRCVVSTKI